MGKNVVTAMTTGAIGWNLLVALVGMASGTQGVGMRTVQGKARGAVVKLRLPPVMGGVAVIALLAQSLLVAVVVLMTAKAVGWSIAPVNNRLVTFTAGHAFSGQGFAGKGFSRKGFPRQSSVNGMAAVTFGSGVAAYQLKVSLLMVEQLLTESNDVSIATLVFGMALAAFTGNGRFETMKPLLGRHIGGDVFMAVEAQAALILIPKAAMTLGTLGF